MIRVDIRSHRLVPKHIVLEDEEASKALQELNIDKSQLPKILISDPVIRLIEGKTGQVVKIIRDSPTSGVEISYRVIIDN